LGRDEIDRLILVGREFAEVGEVTLEQMLASWVVHDVDHVAQITPLLPRDHLK